MPSPSEVVCDLVPIEKVEVMEPERSGPYAMQEDPPIWSAYRRVLRDRGGMAGELSALQKPQFNEQARSEDLCLVIATAEHQAFANILITIGVVPSGTGK